MAKTDTRKEIFVYADWMGIKEPPALKLRLPFITFVTSDAVSGSPSGSKSLSNTPGIPNVFVSTVPPVMVE